MAGTGKSTISRTVAQNFADKGDLSASFFFKRGEGDRGHARMLFTTIAAQLVQKLPSLALHVQNVIEADPTILTKALKQQFDTLVLEPLGRLPFDPQKPLMIAKIGLAASVISVIDLSSKVASWCSEYYANVKNAKGDIERLQGETQRLKETLRLVQSLCDGPNGAKLQASQDLRDGVNNCEKHFTQLGTRLAPRTRQKAMSRFRALRWPFRKNEVDEIIGKLGKCRDNISFNLQVDQAYVFLSIFCPKQKLNNIE